MEKINYLYYFIVLDIKTEPNIGTEHFNITSFNYVTIKPVINDNANVSSTLLKVAHVPCTLCAFVSSFEFTYIRIVQTPQREVIILTNLKDSNT